MIIQFQSQLLTWIIPLPCFLLWSFSGTLFLVATICREILSGFISSKLIFPHKTNKQTKILLWIMVWLMTSRRRQRWDTAWNRWLDRSRDGDGDLWRFPPDTQEERQLIVSVMKNEVWKETNLHPTYQITRLRIPLLFGLGTPEVSDVTVIFRALRRPLWCFYMPDTFLFRLWHWYSFCCKSSKPWGYLWLGLYWTLSSHSRLSQLFLPPKGDSYIYISFLGPHHSSGLHSLLLGLLLSDCISFPLSYNNLPQAQDSSY